jgi:hypothetical protein
MFPASLLAPEPTLLPAPMTLLVALWLCRIFSFAAFTSSMLDKVASAVAVPWAPLGSIAAAFSSYRVKSTDATHVGGYTIMDDNATAAVLWMLMKPYAEVTPTRQL